MDNNAADHYWNLADSIWSEMRTLGPFNDFLIGRPAANDVYFNYLKERYTKAVETAKELDPAWQRKTRPT